MKLREKINIRFLALMLLIFSVAGVSFYAVLGRVVDQNIKEMLESRKAYLLLNLRKAGSNIDSTTSLDHSIIIRKINESVEYENYSDTMAFDQAEKELIPFRKLTFTAHSTESTYKIILLQSLLELEDLRLVIFSFMGVLFLVVMLSLFFVNRWLSSKTWNPFFTSLQLLRSWKFSENKAVKFERTGIEEFDQMNGVLEEMMAKIKSDFENLKEFTENASHEIQTPLAIVKSKLELVLQDQSLAEGQRQQIQAAFESAIRLSKLNEALLLLSKIENQQFVGEKEIDFCQLIHSRLEYLEELFSLKKVTVEVKLEVAVFFSMNPLLAEILVNNLLSNALRHNYEGGKILIESDNWKIVISNTGIPKEFDTAKLFQRFAKNTASQDSNGLGLSISKEICRFNHLKLSYSYTEKFHSFAIEGKS